VNTHLRHVFAKLQVNSRVDLTRLATERNGEDAAEIARSSRTA
jgi:DNA-binding CsgD family transcriptional regulator